MQLAPDLTVSKLSELADEAIGFIVLKTGLRGGNSETGVGAPALLTRLARGDLDLTASTRRSTGYRAMSLIAG